MVRVLGVGHRAAQLVVRAGETRQAFVDLRRIPLALDQRVPDEKLARPGAVDAGELHATAGDDLDPEQRDLLVGDGGPGILRPVRLAHLTFREVAREGFGPGRVDRGDRAGVET